MEPLTPILLQRPHWECVSDNLRDIMVIVGQQDFADRFYLADGTALALQLGHRVSIDLDFFAAADELFDESRREIMAALRSQLELEIIQNAVGSLLLNVGGVALGFFSYGFPLLAPTLSTGQITLAGLLDIGLMKLDGIAGRGMKKDFVDFYFIVQRLSLDEMLQHGGDKYPTVRDFGVMALEALSDFTVADQQAPIQTFPPVVWKDVKAFCGQEVQRIGRKWFEEGSS